jgi:UDP-2-acetamido-3-amino-2,3-dideoxy-glucuronate N-acetyltransferase
MNQIPKIAVLGCGYWGKNLVRNFRELGALAMVCDSSIGGRQTATQIAPEVPFSTSFEDVLKESSVQGVAIATPAETHYALVLAALRAGKHVFVEKPLALTVSQGREMMHEAEKSERILMVGHLLQYHPHVRKMLEMVHAGTLGKLQYITSNRLNLGKIRREENSLWSFAPHDLSVILAIGGNQLPEQVRCVGEAWLTKGVADTTLTMLRFSGGLRAHVYVSWLNPFKEQKLTIVGSNAMLVMDDSQPWSDKLILHQQPIVWSSDKIPVATKSPGEAIAIPEAEPLREECSHFLNCISSGSKPQTDAAEGVRVLAVLQAAQESLDRDGEAVRPTIDWPKISDTPDYVHPSAHIDEGAFVGKGTKVWHYSHVLKGARIGERCVLGQNVNIDSGAVIGSNVKIQNNVSVYSGVILEDDVFLGPSCVLTNVTNPRSQVNRHKLYETTRIRKGATIGANATIVCGIIIGRYAFIGAGAVVTKDVPDYGMVIGNPGKQIGWMSRHGHRLEFDTEGAAFCPESGFKYCINRGCGQNIVSCTDLSEELPLPLEKTVGEKTYDNFKVARSVGSK